MRAHVIGLFGCQFPVLVLGVSGVSLVQVAANSDARTSAVVVTEFSAQLCGSDAVVMNAHEVMMHDALVDRIPPRCPRKT